MGSDVSTSTAMAIRLTRAFAAVSDEDGARIQVDRLGPRDREATSPA
jgi:uncharacterized protein YeaO (DUF488 family)